MLSAVRDRGRQTAMLRITQSSGTGHTRTIRLEGKLLQPWVAEVRRVCAASDDPLERSNLDLSALAYVDQAGANLLRDLIRSGMAVSVCSAFVAELLR